MNGSKEELCIVELILILLSSWLSWKRGGPESSFLSVFQSV